MKTTRVFDLYSIELVVLLLWLSLYSLLSSPSSPPSPTSFVLIIITVDVHCEMYNRSLCNLILKSHVCGLLGSCSFLFKINPKNLNSLNNTSSYRAFIFLECANFERSYTARMRSDEHRVSRGCPPRVRYTPRRPFATSCHRLHCSL